MLTVADADDSFLAGKAKFEQWKDDFEARWMLPQAKLLLLSWWETIPDERRQQMKDEKPTEYAALEKEIKRLKGE